METHSLDKVAFDEILTEWASIRPTDPEAESTLQAHKTFELLAQHEEATFPLVRGHILHPAQHSFLTLFRNKAAL